MSRSLARASEQTVLSLMASAIARTASKSPLLEAAKPASMTSTRSRSNCRAMRSFSSRVIEAPGDCSPSRKVVSKMMSLSVMVWLSRGWVRKQLENENGPLRCAGGPLIGKEFADESDQRTRKGGQ
jgi:hypothetical protein